MKVLPLTLLLGAVACSSSTTSPPPQHATVSTAGAPKADLTKFQTFTFGPANPPSENFAVTPRSLEVQRKLAELVGASLEARGYQSRADKADMLIKVSAGNGTLPGDKVQRGNSDAQEPGGYIGIDVYESATGVSIWHGSASAAIDPERIDEKLLATGVSTMLADFPARHD